MTDNGYVQKPDGTWELLTEKARREVMASPQPSKQQLRNFTVDLLFECERLQRMVTKYQTVANELLELVDAETG